VKKLKTIRIPVDKFKVVECPECKGKVDQDFLYECPLCHNLKKIAILDWSLYLKKQSDEWPNDSTDAPSHPLWSSDPIKEKQLEKQLKHFVFSPKTPAAKKKTTNICENVYNYYRPYIEIISKKYSYFANSKEDIEGEATLCLIKAMRKYNQLLSSKHKKTIMPFKLLFRKMMTHNIIEWIRRRKKHGSYDSYGCGPY